MCPDALDNDTQEIAIGHPLRNPNCSAWTNSFGDWYVRRLLDAGWTPRLVTVGTPDNESR